MTIIAVSSPRKLLVVTLIASCVAPAAVLSEDRLRDVIDRQVEAGWNTSNLTPVEASMEPEFVRRVYLDLLGVIPSYEEAVAFLDDTGSHKREKLVEKLLAHPKFGVHQSDIWERKVLKWDDPRGTHIYSNNCGQRLALANGDVQMSFTFGPKAEHRMVSGVHATFDGELLKVREVGEPILNPNGRGLLEPSVTRFDDKFWITIRAEDNRGYVSVSDDGLRWEDKRAWAWDDGTPLDMSTTQQHWLTHSDGLFLVYTRKDASNTNVIRWRPPLWVAQVDIDRRCLIRSTEQVVLPLVGDGVKKPDHVALMGNFSVTNVSPEESWVTVGEWMPRNGYRGDVLLARIRWSKPNRRPLW